MDGKGGKGDRKGYQDPYDPYGKGGRDDGYRGYDGSKGYNENGPKGRGPDAGSYGDTRYDFDRGDKRGGKKGGKYDDDRGKDSGKGSSDMYGGKGKATRDGGKKGSGKDADFGGKKGSDKNDSKGKGKDKRKGGKDELGAPIKGQTAFVVQPGQVDMVPMAKGKGKQAAPLGKPTPAPKAPQSAKARPKEKPTGKGMAPDLIQRAQAPPLKNLPLAKASLAKPPRVESSVAKWMCIVENNQVDEKLVSLSLPELRARATEVGVTSETLMRAELIHAVMAAERTGEKFVPQNRGKSAIVEAVYEVGLLISADIGELMKLPTEVLFKIAAGLEVPVPKTVSAAVVASVIAEKRRGSLMSTLHVAEMVHELTQVEAARVHAERVAMAAVLPLGC
jgi:hypothetical protein